MIKEKLNSNALSLKAFMTSQQQQQKKQFPVVSVTKLFFP